MTIPVTLSSSFKPKPKGPDLGFGNFTTDHMFLCDYHAGRGWVDPRVVPYGPIVMDPAALVLHYGQALFEGLKAYRQPDGGVALFRADRNASRFTASAARMAMPELPEALFLDAVRRLVEVDADWVPEEPGTSLYVRPVMVANEAALAVRRAEHFVFYILLSPVAALYQPGRPAYKLLVSEEYSRSSNGGSGAAKTSGNYGQTIVALEGARAQGYDNVLWLDGAYREFIEEAGITNIFVAGRDGVITPPLNGRILPGVTRDSAIRLMTDWGMPVIEREVSIREVVAGIDDGSVSEIFVTGTATLVAPVGTITYKGTTHTLRASSEATSYARRLYTTLDGIQCGRLADPFGWTMTLK